MTESDDTINEIESGILQPRLEKRQVMVLAGLMRHYTLENRHEIPALWSLFGPRIGTIPAAVGAAAYGVIREIPDDSGFDYMAGVEVSDTAQFTSDMTTISFPEQQYAVFAHPGAVSALCETIDTVFHKWLPKSGRELTGNPYYFEYYGPNFDPETGTGDIEIWLPIKD